MGVLFQIHCALNRLTHRHSCHRGESVQRVGEDRRYFDSESTCSRNTGGFSGFAPSGVGRRSGKALWRSSRSSRPRKKNASRHLDHTSK